MPQTYQPKYRYKAKHFVKNVTITQEMVRENRNLRRFMRIRKLVYMLNPAIAFILLLLFLTLFLTGVI